MRTPALARVSFLAVALLTLARGVEATPYLPADIVVGGTVTGSFSFPILNSPPDLDPSPGRGYYAVGGPEARMSVTAGGAEFSTILTGLLVQVIDTSVDADFLQFGGVGDEASFAPYLSGFLRQNPRLEPRGEVGMVFRFPISYFSSDALPTTIDPAATAANPSSPPGAGIYGGVSGVSMQTSTTGIREWAFQFTIDPIDMNITTTAGVLNGRFMGAIYEVDDRTMAGPPSVVPEPASLLLFGTGLLALRKLARRVGALQRA